MKSNESRRGRLIAFEGLDQSGKETQAVALKDYLRARGRRVRILSFPDYGTSIGEEIARALQGERDYGPDVMQLLFIANRYEKKPEIQAFVAQGGIIISDRYVSSSVAYGEAGGLDPAWLADAQRFLPLPDLTILLDITPEIAARRKGQNRDRYERDLDMLGRVRASYLRLVEQPGWIRVDGEQPKQTVSAEIAAAVLAVMSDES